MFRITVDQYDRMVQDGRLGEHDRVELLAGVLVRRMPKNPDRVWAVAQLSEALAACRAARWHVRKEDPVRIPDYDEPEPDLAVIRGARASFRGRHPGAKDLALVVEVANSSLDDGRGVRLERYARAGIPVYWIVNLRDRQIEIHTKPDPSAGRYGGREIVGSNGEAALRIDGQEVARVRVADLLA